MFTHQFSWYCFVIFDTEASTDPAIVAVEYDKFITISQNIDPPVCSTFIVHFQNKNKRKISGFAEMFMLKFRYVCRIILRVKFAFPQGNPRW